eukprot:GGOE01041394.1.p1 GENE.GGOE01041394.1~~GGOE01041394.1.p1  ORF type:complete len:450 (-),score=88.91 GGOE01041394.1:178-1482(-)
MASPDLQTQLFSMELLLPPAVPSKTDADVTSHWRSLSNAPSGGDGGAKGGRHRKLFWGPQATLRPRDALQDGYRVMAPPTTQEVEEFELVRQQSRPAPRVRPKPEARQPSFSTPPIQSNGAVSQGRQRWDSAASPKHREATHTSADTSTAKSSRFHPPADALPTKMLKRKQTTKLSEGTSEMPTCHARRTAEGDAEPCIPINEAASPPVDGKKQRKGKRQRTKPAVKEDTNTPTDCHLDATAVPPTASTAGDGAAVQRNTWADTQAARRERNRRTLFVGQCPAGMNEQHVRQLFKSVGPDAVEALQPVLAWDGKPKGCAFVTFRTPELAQAALRLPNPKVLGKSIALSPVRDTAEDKDSRTVRLDGCPEFVTEFNLRHHFDGLRVERVQPITNRRGEHSGIVFVRFGSPQEAFQAARPGTITIGGETMTVKRLG